MVPSGVMGSELLLRRETVDPALLCVLAIFEYISLHEIMSCCDPKGHLFKCRAMHLTEQLLIARCRVARVLRRNQYQSAERLNSSPGADCSVPSSSSPAFVNIRDCCLRCEVCFC